MRLRVFALVAAGALLLAACGSDDPTVQDAGEIVEEAEEAVEEAEEAEEAAVELPAQVATVDNAFAPSMLEAVSGDEVAFTVVNNGQNPHSFTIDDIDVDTGVLGSGESAEASFTMGDQDLLYYCTVHGAEVMSGTISVAG